MKISTRNIRTIKERLQRLYDEFNINPLDKDDDVKLGDDCVFISYPDDELDEPISVEDFLEYTKDLDGFCMEDDTTVRMDGIRQTILSVDDYKFEYLVPEI